MDIRKIIREELEESDMDWIQDVNLGSEELMVGSEYKVVDKVSTLRPNETFVVMDMGEDNLGDYVHLWVNGDENVTYRRELIQNAIYTGRISPVKWGSEDYPKPRRLREEEDFDWIKQTDYIEIGGATGIPKDKAILGEKVRTNMGYTFTIEDVDPSDGWVWGSDLGRHAYIGERGSPIYDELEYEERNWHNPMFLSKITTLDM